MHEFSQWISQVLSTEDFMTRGLCGHWSPTYRALAIVCELVFGVSYMAIPPALVFLWFLKRRVYGRASLILLGAATFVFWCGISHLCQVAVWWWPAYRLFTLLLIPGALSSIVFVFHLPAAMWHIVQLPMPSQLLTAIEASEAANAELAAANADLKRKQRAMQATIIRLERAKEIVAQAEQADSWRDQQFEILSGAIKTLNRGME